MTWQPISTAPERRPVLVWDNAQEQCVMAIKVVGHSSHWWNIYDPYTANVGGEIPTGDITHWMALPNALTT